MERRTAIACEDGIEIRIEAGSRIYARLRVRKDYADIGRYADARSRLETLLVDPLCRLSRGFIDRVTAINRFGCTGTALMTYLSRILTSFSVFVRRCEGRADLFRDYRSLRFTGLYRLLILVLGIVTMRSR